MQEANDVSKKDAKNLKRIKKNVGTAYKYAKPNFDRYHKYRSFVFDSALTASDISTLQSLNKPQIEFNILEAYISRLRGEFSKQEPSFEVSANDDQDVPEKTLKLVEGHTRHIMFEASKNNMAYSIYTDILSGGFSAMKVYTKYTGEMSFNQDICMERCYDPTLTGFDPLARESHKGDGQYCFELFPKTKDECEEMGIDLKGIKFTRSFEGFNWAYNNKKEDIVLICDYYEKKKKRVKIVKLANGKVLRSDKYDKYLEEWNMGGHIEQPAMIVSTRMTEIETICRYRLIDNQIIEYVETDYKKLPIIFVDGNSILIRLNNESAVQQMTRPYVYHAIGTQRLKNFAGQTLANELENMVMHKFMVAKEAIPLNYADAYKNPQRASVLVYNQFWNNDATARLDPPQAIVRAPTPPEVTNTFTLTDTATQNILGSYDAQLGINDNQLSGVAIVEGATQSNAAAMPYVVGYMQALNRAGEIIVDLMPKYLTGARTLPIVAKDSNKTFEKINQNGNITFDYKDDAINIKIEAGVNFAIQKSRAIQQIGMLAKTMPMFGAFFQAVGLDILLDNLEFHGADVLRDRAKPYMEQLKKQQAKQSQVPTLPELKAQEIQLKTQEVQGKLKNETMEIQVKAQDNEAKNQIEMSNTTISKQQADTEQMQVISELTQAHDQNMIDLARVDAEKSGQAIDLALSITDQAHRHTQEAVDMAHSHLHDKASLAVDLMKATQPKTPPATT